MEHFFGEKKKKKKRKKQKRYSSRHGIVFYFLMLLWVFIELCYRISRIERDNSQKRALLGDQRTRVKQALENAKSDAESLVGTLIGLQFTTL